MAEEKHGLLAETEMLRLSFCNAHMDSMCENLMIRLPELNLRQLILDKDNWVEAGIVTTAKVT